MILCRYKHVIGHEDVTVRTLDYEKDETYLTCVDVLLSNVHEGDKLVLDGKTFYRSSTPAYNSLYEYVSSRVEYIGVVPKKRYICYDHLEQLYVIKNRLGEFLIATKEYWDDFTDGDYKRYSLKEV